MSKSKKILVIVLSVILALAIGIGIWYIAAPREFLQTFLSDQAYAKITLAQNGKRMSKKVKNLTGDKKAYYIDGSLGADIEADLLLDSEDAAKALSDYAQTLAFDGNIYFNDDATCVKLGVSDADGTILSGEAVLDENVQCFKVDQFDLGWQSFTKKEESNVSVTSSESETEEELKEAEIYISNGKEIKIGDTSTNGEAITISMDAESFEAIFSNVVDMINVEEYQTKLLKFQSSISNFLEEKNVRQVTANLFVNKRNDIVAVSIDLEGQDNLSFSFVISDVKDDSYALEYKTSSLKLDAEFALKTTAFESFEIPSESEVSELDKEALKSAAMEYLLGDFISAHPSLQEAFSSLITPLIQSAVSSLFGNIGSSDSSESILSSFGNIFGNVLEEGSSQVTEAISGIFSSLFSLSEGEQ